MERRRTPRTLRSASNQQDELLELLVQKYAKQMEPKANILERIFAPIRAVSSIPDALYDAIYERGGVQHAPIEYGKNLLGGLATTFLGKKQEDQQKISDILMEEGYLTGDDPASKVVRSGINIAGDIALNPLTYLKFLPTVLSEDVARRAVENTIGATKGGPTKEIARFTEDIVSKISQKPVSEAINIVQSELGQKASENFYTNLMGIGETLNKAGGIKFMGQTITENPEIAEVVKGVINPPHGLLKGGKKLAEKLAPEVTKNVKAALYDVFDPLKAAVLTGRGEIATESLKKLREEYTIGERTLAKIAPLKKLLENVPEEERLQMPYLIQGTKRLDSEYIFPGIGGKELSEKGKEFIMKYQDFLEPITETLKEAGGLEDVISPEKGLYIMQHPIAYTRKFLEGRMKKGMVESMGEEIGKIRFSELMQDRGIKKALEETGEVPVEKVDRFLRGMDVLIGGEKGLKPFSTLASKGREFGTLLEGEAAGVKYETNINKLLTLQTEGQLGRMSDLMFGNVLSQIRDSKGVNFFAEKPGGQYKQSIYLPGVGTRYADSYTTRVLENYFDAFSSKTGFDKTLEGLDKVMSGWKKLVTGGGPSFIRYHLRNHLDDNLRMILDGADTSKLVSDYGIGQEILDFRRVSSEVGVEEALKEFAGKKTSGFLKSIGRKDDMKSFYNELLRTGVLSDVGKSAEEAGQQLTAEGLSAIDKALTLGGRTMDFEQLRRVTYYINQLRKTGNSSEAAEAVRRTLFNYMELSKTERDVGRRIMPFYSFLKNNIKFQFETMVNHPERYSKMINLLDSIKAGFVGNDKEGWEAMPGWLRDERYSVPLSKKDGELTVMSNLGLSFEDLGELDPEGLISKMNPLLKFALEQATGQSTFQGRPIAELRGGERYSTHPLRALLGYQERERGGRIQKTVDPRLKYLAENLPYLSSLNTLASQLGMLTSKERFTQGLSETALPVKVYRMDIEASKRGREVEDLDELYELLYRKGISDRFSRYYIPADIRDKLLKELR